MSNCQCGGIIRGTEPYMDILRSCMCASPIMIAPTGIVYTTTTTTPTKVPMTPKPQTNTIGDVITKLRAGKDPETGELHITEAEATQAINAYYLAEVLDMIGEDIKPHTVGFGGVMGLNTSDHTANKLKADYRKAAKERFS